MIFITKSIENEYSSYCINSNTISEYRKKIIISELLIQLRRCNRPNIRQILECLYLRYDEVSRIAFIREISNVKIVWADDSVDYLPFQPFEDCLHSLFIQRYKEL